MQPIHERRAYEKGLPLHAALVRDLEFFAHWHTDVELLFVLSGSIAVSVNLERRVLPEGSLAVCGSRDIHYYERVDGGSETILVIFRSELLGQAPLWPSAGRLGGHFATPGEHRDLAAAAERIMRAILVETRERQRAYESLVRGGVLELCALSERELGAGAGEARVPGGAEKEGFATLERMQLAIDYIYERSDRPIALPDAARAASLSPSYFSRLFSRATGASFRGFLNGIRIERAEELMLDPRRRIADVALECGFESLRTFNRAYLALRGRPPGGERRRPRGALALDRQGVVADPVVEGVRALPPLDEAHDLVREGREGRLDPALE
jgi:AraC-like DNA-binding protein